jgi:diguanylate cyclase (GGDEF)-like protein
MNKSWITQLCGALAVFLGLTVLLGWVLQNPTLIQIFSSLVGMVISTAVCLSLAGACLLMPPTYSRAMILRAICGALIVSIGIGVLVENFFDVGIGIDWPSAHSWLHDANPRPGRMAPNTATAFIAMGLLLLLSRAAPSPSIRLWRRVLVIATLTLGLSGLFGYFLKLELLYQLKNITRMALHTAIGITIVGLGFLAENRPTDKAKEQSSEIMPIALGALIAVAIVAGIGVFTFMQNQVERMTGGYLLNLHHDHALYFASTIQQRTQRALTISNRPNAVVPLRKLLSGSADPALIQPLQREAQSYLPHGFSWVAFYQGGRLLTAAGKPLAKPPIEISLRGEDKRVLAWKDGYYLRTRLPVYDEHGVVGEVVAEQSLDVLDELSLDANRAGQTGELGLCSLTTTNLECFPQRFRPQPYSIAPVIGDQPLPMTLARDGATGIVSALDYRRQYVLAAYGPVGDLGIGIVMKMDWAELYAPLREELLIMLLVLAVVVAISLWLLQQRLRPLVVQLVESKKAAEASQARFLAASEHSLDGFYILESVRDSADQIIDFRFTYLNENGAQLISNKPRHELTGRNVGDVLPLIRSGGHLNKYKDVVLTGVPHKEEFAISAPGVTATWLNQQVVRLGDGVAVSARDVSARRNAEEELKRQAQNDTLTGLPNRALFRDRLQQAMARARRHDKPMAVMYLDIDHFKQINDTMGHAGGDEVLRAFGYRLSCSVRATDTVARLAGDEFTVILEELRGPIDVEVVAAKILDAIVPPVRVDQEDLKISASIGIAIYHKEKITAETLIDRADKALYSVKRRGRGGYELYRAEEKNDATQESRRR